MTKSRQKPQSAVARIAQGLRTIALATDPGGYVGSEESLSRKFDVTGPTLRQAIRLLEHEQVIEVRRGVRGGYYADRPNGETISRVAAVYLRSRLGSFDEIQVFVEFIQPLLVDLALASNRLGELRRFAYPDKLAETHEQFVSEQSEFVNLLWEIINNAPMQLVYQIFFQVGSGIELRSGGKLSQGTLEIQANRIKFAESLLVGDREKALECALFDTRIVHDGIKQNYLAAQTLAEGV